MNALLISFALAAANDFTVTSPQLSEGATLKDEQVFNGMGCTGKNVSPELVWKNAPAAAKSFAVTVYDPDAPTGSGWWHWLMVNIPTNVTSLKADASKNAPEGTLQTRTDFGAPGFGGACPPPGDKPHRYIVTVWALKTDKIAVDKDASGAMVGYNLNANAIAKATLTGKYGR
jgi:Raf kinase inhibitor-like YbhB/YbcL family protein